MTHSKRFLLVGAEGFHNHNIGGNNEAFETVKEMVHYVQYMNLRTEYLDVYDKEEKVTFDLADVA